MRHRTPTPQFLRSTLVQLVVVLAVVPPAIFVAGTPGTVSLLSGAACAVVPQAFFALRMAFAARSSAARAARIGMSAAAGKFVLSAAAFAMVFALQPSSPGLVFVGFGLMWLVQLVESIRLVRRPPDQR